MPPRRAPRPTSAVRANPSGAHLGGVVRAGLEALKERHDLDELVCLDSPTAFGAIGYFYRDFRQVSDDEVRKQLDADTLRQADEVLAAIAKIEIEKPVSPPAAGIQFPETSP